MHRKSFVRGLLLVVFSVASSLTLAPKGFAKTDGDAWKDTGVDFTLAEYFATKVYPCDKSEQYQLACMELVNGMGANLVPMQILIPKGDEADYANAKITVVKDLGAVTLAEVEWDKSTLSPLASNKLNKARVAAMAAAAKESFKTTPGFDYLGLAREMLAKVKPSASISQSAIIAFAVNRMIEVVDGHSHLDATVAMQSDINNADMNLVGIGATIAAAPEGTLVDHVIEDTAADRAGVQDGDIILTVDTCPDGEVKSECTLTTKGVDNLKVATFIRGVAGTSVKLVIDRKGQRIELKVTRAPISIKNVELKIVEDIPGAKVARVVLRSFNDDNACDKITQMLHTLDSDVIGVILDVRSDGGGLLDQALCIGGRFVGPRVIAIQRQVTDGQTDPTPKFLKSKWAMATELPVVVLINNGSASGSELVAGALQDYQRAWIMGTTSFGKGSVQSDEKQIGIFDKTVSWFQTIARFYQPLDHTNQQVGVQPDFVVYPRPNMTDEEKFEPREGDLVPSALGSIGKVWTQPRTAEIEKLQNGCLSAKRADAIYKAREGTVRPNRNDYQLYSAEELLACEAHKVSL